MISLVQTDPTYKSLYQLCKPYYTDSKSVQEALACDTIENDLEQVLDTWDMEMDGTDWIKDINNGADAGSITIFRKMSAKLIALANGEGLSHIDKGEGNHEMIGTAIDIEQRIMTGIVRLVFMKCYNGLYHGDDPGIDRYYQNSNVDREEMKWLVDNLGMDAENGDGNRLLEHDFSRRDAYKRAIEIFVREDMCYLSMWWSPLAMQLYVEVTRTNIWVYSDLFSGRQLFIPINRYGKWQESVGVGSGVPQSAIYVVDCGALRLDGLV